ncbi:MAG TPA: response regulator [Sphingomicrobium sp.]|nr:response regulator [Sphingomicrobium sp.]
MGQTNVTDLHSGEQPRLLVIEPNRLYLGVIARRLGQFGFRVATARSAQEGLAELHRLPVDLVLSELRLPGTTGVELVRMMREDAAHRHLPVLLIVGRTDRKGAVAGFSAGADGIVRKPFHFEVLAARIKREIERARTVENLRHDNAALDARVVSRAIELGEMRARWEASEAERRRLAFASGAAA